MQKSRDTLLRPNDHLIHDLRRVLEEFGVNFDDEELVNTAMLIAFAQISLGERSQIPRNTMRQLK